MHFIVRERKEIQWIELISIRATVQAVFGKLNFHILLINLDSGSVCKENRVSERVKKFLYAAQVSFEHLN